MSNKVNAFAVVLNDDISEEEAQEVAKAISRLRGVLAVTPNAANLSFQVADMRIKREISERLSDVLRIDYKF